MTMTVFLFVVAIVSQLDNPMNTVQTQDHPSKSIFEKKQART
tara:strand:- start:90523 stop:90648 length:126 start_codon:yes stop_codon:yes gene_type:complete